MCSHDLARCIGNISNNPASFVDIFLCCSNIIQNDSDEEFTIRDRKFKLNCKVYASVDLYAFDDIKIKYYSLNSL